MHGQEEDVGAMIGSVHVAEPTYFCSNSIVLKRHVSSRWQHPDQTDKRSLFLKFDYFSSDFVWF